MNTTRGAEQTMQTDAPSKPGKEELTSRAARVRLLVFDVDGVLTDGGLYYGDGGELMKRFDVKDGHALVMARLSGLPAAILTARTSGIVEARGRELGLAAVFQGRRDKGAALDELLQQLGVPHEACAYMGDDHNDLAPLSRVGLSACPADAVPEVRQEVHFVAQSPGGRGAARELVELCLKASARWDGAVGLMRGTDGRSAQRG
ncbi:3-deoxy-D-manno-octulosonate 8-phosphate phosphatase (KDO 8-P phosphatase) [Myxococcus fulvus]|jgi:3-deoxy-D-manno-octulosonate 8-phosphate phosphatase (KDO 8-P phosphatase)|uniref:3-deoxy-D-manno-octulosonate 8-phosphate phosphatase (KDO 8-P phosphatase) n=2 Tax=Myxococcaceae TaxID=31 RepID=A0A511STW4_MYXFU|nr:3-deoxy-D-manno-octulosonate 8-phosphate phosphatase [Myxococcus fulvus 124B02]BDT31574.1 HAD hydrolase family protein [Myxococcus sp. MH1]GEN05366.1 hydrolase [Myxococcus fulvus]SET09520.1 3-deoxy-D-manno-octulosonate 8-phosphate phosphatase (KDO 8-P phosphatase) [Myxococcus fulvus]